MMALNLKSRLRNIFFLTLCLGRLIVRGPAIQNIKRPRKILICQFAKLGDMICTTPMFRAVKIQYPDCRLYVLGNERNAEVVAHNPDVDRYIIYRRNFFETVQELRVEDIDFACVTSPGLTSLAILFFAGIRRIAAPVIRSGFSPYESRGYKLLRKFVISVEHHMGRYVPQEYLRLLEPIGIKSTDTKKHLFFSRNAAEKTEKLFRDYGIFPDRELVVCLAPSVGHKIRLWSSKKFAEVAEYILQAYKARIIVVGGVRDVQEVNAVWEYITENDSEKSKRVLKVLHLDVDQLKALIARSHLFISVESGPLFIAEAFEIPLINIVGPVDDREQSPRDTFSRIVKLERREAPALQVMNAHGYDHQEARRQIDKISVSQVISAIHELMICRKSYLPKMIFPDRVSG